MSRDLLANLVQQVEGSDLESEMFGKEIESNMTMYRDFIKKTSSFSKYFNSLTRMIDNLQNTMDGKENLEDQILKNVKNDSKNNYINKEMKGELVDFQKQYLRFEEKVKGMELAVLSYFNSLINSYINSNKKDLENRESLASKLTDKLGTLDTKSQKHDLKVLKEEIIGPFFQTLFKEEVRKDIKIKKFFTDFNEAVKDLEEFKAESAKKRLALLSGNDGSKGQKIKEKIDDLKNAYKKLAGVKDNIVSCVNDYLKNFSELEDKKY